MYRQLALLILTVMLSACGAAAPTTTAPTSAATGITAEPAATAAPATAETGVLPATVPPSAPTDVPASVSAPTEETAMNPTAPSNAPEGSAEAMTALAKQDLATRANVNQADIKVVSVTEMEWRDSSLGCAQPDQAYMQVITPGYLIMLEANGNTYQYNTNIQKTVVYCEQG